MKAYLKLLACSEWLTEKRIKNICIVWLFTVILCAEFIVESICKLWGV
ncbi:hypothetical protein barba126A_phanotate57 [Rheinheimera phage vB_RspM_barba_12-6A]|uniref:Uncharacterized protein n=1 Tax=Rheinheimera phage vB_RspM_Barba21S TaxID=2565664 RepID=A0A4P8N8W4_9CAUD|nr:hypothetical protein Barba21S_gp049 [Rheinheimera phage vB_RspM_Barba21S]QNO02000.1 hypothetical protein barba109A_phanotate8 [Rheinheimera phage vB_RspM_barba_10-9A]QNO02166.1 hypothetical protein barba109B_phanotate8 [Rheinheimera phage vB_RspM_barba_10-9B]QNO02740.1 hypothetical protein barba109E_phanotate92 [Rheinheimera phage vB_RspM_barba_10-9E]QNO03319.1 hypothetical protein barba109I_phanotate21 [Rheinheimera phage vB_RspM_barba_10-9I]QNO03540.1 hypothetical protein barba109J_phanot